MFLIQTKCATDKEDGSESDRIALHVVQMPVPVRARFLRVIRLDKWTAGTCKQCLFCKTYARVEYS